MEFIQHYISHGKTSGLPAAQTVFTRRNGHGVSVNFRGISGEPISSRVT